MNSAVIGLRRDWWLARLAAANVPPLRPRVPFRVGGVPVGSVEPGFLEKIAHSGLLDGQCALQKTEQQGWNICGDADTALAALAAAMRTLGCAGAWRDELLAVCDHNGVRCGVIERAAVRPLGITTHAVHLVGAHADGRVWVQQRSLDKATDPGRWDTLVGGMVPARDDTLAALVRESWEEAGLLPVQVGQPQYRGRLRITRPTADAGGVGQVVEDIDWYHVVLPADCAPRNQDGEVQGFALLDADTLGKWLQEDRFTLDASLMLGQFLLDNGVPLLD